MNHGRIEPGTNTQVVSNAPALLKPLKIRKCDLYVEKAPCTTGPTASICLSRSCAIRALYLAQLQEDDLNLLF
jgi:hypothetical protein